MDNFAKRVVDKSKRARQTKQDKFGTNMKA